MNTIKAFTLAILFIAGVYGREYVTYYYSATSGCPNDVTNAPVKISQATGVCMLRFPAPGSRIFSCNATDITEVKCTDTACSVGCTTSSVSIDACAATPYGSFLQTCTQQAVDGSYAPSFVGSQYEDGACSDQTGPVAVYVAQLDTCIGPYASFVANFGQVYTCVSSAVQYKNCSSSDCSTSCGTNVPYPSGCQTTARNLVTGSSIGECSSGSGPSGSTPMSSSPVAQTPAAGPSGSQTPTGSQTPSGQNTPSAGPSANSPTTKKSNAYATSVAPFVMYAVAGVLL